MLMTKDLINDIEEQYVPMLKMVNIPDFTKCISIFSGLKMNEIDDGTIKDYLHTWAKNKYRFFEMLNNKLKSDVKFAYKKCRDDIVSEVRNLEKSYPAYALWLEEFRNLKNNKIESSDLSWQIRDTISTLFSGYRIGGSSLTRFFKHMLNAPDGLVTEIGRIFENDTVEAMHTISIDPVDIMLASENPYKWESCYRLETDNSASHADGCMAAVLDTSSLITYVWNNEGKLNLYDNYELKNVRYKRMRQWIAISPKFTTVHFNSIYPGKCYDSVLEKQLRAIVEEKISNYLGVRNMWKESDSSFIDRDIYYGYGEYHNHNLYMQSDAEPETFNVYNTSFKCACGCGEIIEGSDEGKEYLGYGFQHNCYEDRYWCEYIDDYCDCSCCEEDCAECDTWIENHPVCSLDNTCKCEDVDWDLASHGVMEADEDHCTHCPHWQECHQPDEDEDEDLD